MIDCSRVSWEVLLEEINLVGYQALQITPCHVWGGGGPGRPSNAKSLQHMHSMRKEWEIQSRTVCRGC